MLQAPVQVSQDPQAIIIGVILSVGGIISPIIMSLMVNRNARQMKIADYARQDLVAERLDKRQNEAEKKAEQVARQAADAATLLVASNRKQEDIARLQNAKLDQIHTLVNSNLTAAMQDQLDARTANLVLLNEAVEVKRLANLEPSEETLGMVDATKIKIAELSAQLTDRKKQTAQAAEQLKVDLNKPINS